MSKNILVCLIACLVLNHFQWGQSASTNTTTHQQRNAKQTKLFAKPQGRGTILDDLYFLGLEELSWTAAHFYCVKEGWKLVSIKTALDQISLEGFLNYYGLNKKSFWTAGNKLADLNTFRWGFNGDKFTYTNWAKGEPNNAGGIEYCVQLNHGTLTWNDIKCEDKFYFICQKYEN